MDFIILRLDCVIPQCVICFTAPKTTNGHHANEGRKNMASDNWAVSCSAVLVLFIECAATIFAAPIASAAAGNAQITVLYAIRPPNSNRSQGPQRYGVKAT